MKRNAKQIIFVVSFFLLIMFIAVIVYANYKRKSIMFTEATPRFILAVINTSEVTYQSTYDNGFTCNLSDLGPPPDGKTISEHHAGLIDAQLASGFRSGYRFLFVGPCETTILDKKKIVMTFRFAAAPGPLQPKGSPYYCTDQTGVIKTHTSSIMDCVEHGKEL